MSEAAAIPAGANPFTARTALALVLFGCFVFVALLWMIGNGMADGEANDGGAHAEGRGLNGYAALSAYLDQRGFEVRHSRSEAGFGRGGLLVLTPPPFAKGRDIEKAVARHRRLGPTLVIVPKWNVVRALSQDTGAKRGWVRLVGSSGLNWPGFLDQVTIHVDKGRGGWWTRGIAGRLPQPQLISWGSGRGLVPLVRSDDGRLLAAFLDDGDFPALDALSPEPIRVLGGERYPLVVVFEPDLLDNYGMAQRPSAQLAEAIARATLGAGGEVTFDLTLNGITRNANLLTLAFTPPFLAATLCLLLAAGATGWRAFLRFGPPRVPGRAIAFGKRALVTNAAALIVRSRRLHLLGSPYAAAARQRLARAFALPRGSDELAGLDRAARAQGAGDHAFSQAAARLASARTERELVKAAVDLHALERTLSR
jgi:hypothetical protein